MSQYNFAIQRFFDNLLENTINVTHQNLLLNGTNVTKHGVHKKSEGVLGFVLSQHSKQFLQCLYNTDCLTEHPGVFSSPSKRNQDLKLLSEPTDLEEKKH